MHGQVRVSCVCIATLSITYRAATASTLYSFYQGQFSISKLGACTGMAGLSLLGIQGMLSLFFEDDPNARGLVRRIQSITANKAASVYFVTLHGPNTPPSSRRCCCAHPTSTLPTARLLGFCHSSPVCGARWAGPQAGPGPGRLSLLNNATAVSLVKEFCVATRPCTVRQ